MPRRVALHVEASGKFRPAGLPDLTLDHDVHHVGTQLVEQPAVVGDGEHPESLVGEGLDPLGAVPQRIDVETRVQFVKDGDTWAQHCELQRLAALLLTARQVHIERTVQQALVETDTFRLRPHDSRDRGWVVAASSERRLEHVVELHPGDLDGVLQSQEQTGLGAFPRLHCQQVHTVQGHRPTGDLVTGTAGEHVRQRGLAGPVGTHHRMNLTGADDQIHTTQDG